MKEAPIQAQLTTDKAVSDFEVLKDSLHEARHCPGADGRSVLWSRGRVERAPPRGVVGAAQRRTCASPAAGGRTCPCASPRGAACAGRRWTPPPASHCRRPPASGAERPLRRSARALRLPVSALLCSVAPGLPRGARPGREGGRGRSARCSRFRRRQLHLPRLSISAPRFRILDPRPLVPDPGYSP